MSDKTGMAPKFGAEEDRRNFLAACGKFAVVTSPAVTLLLSTSLHSTAIAGSSGNRNFSRSDDPDTSGGSGGTKTSRTTSTSSTSGSSGGGGTGSGGSGGGSTTSSGSTGTSSTGGGGGGSGGGGGGDNEAIAGGFDRTGTEGAASTPSASSFAADSASSASDGCSTEEGQRVSVLCGLIRPM